MALPEVVTRNVLNVVTENFNTAGLKHYACRIVYIGDHFLGREELIKVFHTSVEAANAQYSDVSLSGLLLAYDCYFVHILEGSEDTINRQLRFLLQRAREYERSRPRPELVGGAAPTAPSAASAASAPSPADIKGGEPETNVEHKMFKRLKMLIVYHSIRKKTLTDWAVLSAKPPTLLTKLDPFGALVHHMEQLQTCLDKINRLCALFKENRELSFSGLSASDPKMEALPEYVLLEFLLESKHILDLRTYYSYHRRVDHYPFYFEHVWPPQTHYTPRHLYKLKVDDTFVEPLPQQEWQLREQEREREREDGEEPGSSAASSD